MAMPTPQSAPLGTTTKFVNDQLKRIIALKNEFASPEEQFDYTLAEIHLIDTHLSPENDKKAPLVKSLVAWALQEFNSVPGFKTDKRMLPLWLLLGRYSQELRMEGVMDKLYRLGFFKSEPEFYLMWAEHFAAEGQRERVDKILRVCERNCSGWDTASGFGPIIAKYFGTQLPPPAEEDLIAGSEKTIALMDIFSRQSGVVMDAEPTITAPLPVVAPLPVETKLPQSHHANEGRQSAGSTATTAIQRGEQTESMTIFSDYQRCLSTMTDVTGSNTYNGTLMADQASQQITKTLTPFDVPSHHGQANNAQQNRVSSAFSMASHQLTRLSEVSESRSNTLIAAGDGSPVDLAGAQQPTNQAPLMPGSGKQSSGGNQAPTVREIPQPPSRSSTQTVVPARPAIPLVNVQSSFTAQLYKNAIDVFANTLTYGSQPELSAMAGQPHHQGTMAESMTEALATNPPSNGAGAVPKEDFSVFCDQTMEKAPSQASHPESKHLEVKIPIDEAKSATALPSDTHKRPLSKETSAPQEGLLKLSAGNSKAAEPKATCFYLGQPSMMAKDSPMAKKGRQIELSFNEDALLNDSESPDRPPPIITKEEMEEFEMIATPQQYRPPSTVHPSQPPSSIAKSRQSMGGFGAIGLPEESSILKWDEMTVSGAHGKFAISHATSTPCRDHAPLLNLQSPDDPFFGSLTEAEREQLAQRDQIRLFDPAASSEMATGTALQRRLSLDPKQAIEQMQQQMMQNQAKSADKPLQRRSIHYMKPTVASITRAIPSLYLCDEQHKATGNAPASNEAIHPPQPDGADDKENRPKTEANVAKEGGKADELDETTGHNRTKETIPAGALNPWDEAERRKVLAVAPLMVECHVFAEERCPKLDVGRRVDLGGEKFDLAKLLGEGGFAKVFMATTEDGKTCAVKYEVPACPWEVYACSTLRRRLPAAMQPLVMDVRDAYIFPNASAIVYDFHPYGTLLDLSNLYKSQAMEMGGLLVTYFAVQLGRVLEQVHALGIIHADVKPDNLMIVAPVLSEKASLEELLARPAIKLIDWGRAIDMNHFVGQEFYGRAGTNAFDCIEMISNRPWNYQTDYFGFVSTAHVLIFNDYMQTMRHNEKIRPVKQIKRRLALRTMWLDIFEEFLNIPNCQSLPAWSRINAFMLGQLKQAVQQEMGVEWRKALERYNTLMRQHCGGTTTNS